MSGPFDTLLMRLMPIVFVILWATGYIGARMGTPWAEPFTFLAIRFLIAAGLMLLLALFLRAPWPGRTLAAHSFVAGMLLHGLYLGGVFWAIDRGMPAGVAALIVGLQPLLTALVAGPMLGERVDPKMWIGLVVGLVGVSLVLAPKLNVIGEGITVTTLTSILIGTVAITLGTIYQKRFATGVDLSAGAVWQYLGAFSVVGFGAVVSEHFEVTWTGAFIFALAWLVLVLSLGAVSLLMILIRKGAVSSIASLFYLVPAITALIAWGLFGETLTLVQILGMVVTGAAVAVTARGPAKA